MKSVPDLHRQEKDEQNRDTGHRSTGRDKKVVKHQHRVNKKGKNKHVRSNSDRRVKYTAERLRTCQTHQRVDVLNTDHKDVAILHEFWPHLRTSQQIDSAHRLNSTIEGE